MSLAAKIAVSLAVGFLLAAVITDIAYPCTSHDAVEGESISRCVSYDKAMMHPSDLAHNKQHSLTNFSEVVAVTAVTTFALLTLIPSVRKR